MAQLRNRIADAVGVPTDDAVGGRWRRTTRTGIGMDAADEEENENEETRERGRVEERVGDEESDVVPVRFAKRRRHTGVTSPTKKLAGWAC